MRSSAPSRIEDVVATEDQCAACGESNPAGSAFCLFCGTYLGWDEPGGGPATSRSSPVGLAQPTPTAPGPATTPPPANTVRPLPTTQAGGCPACGQHNDSTRRFCSRCGTPLAAAAPTLVVAAQPPVTSSPTGSRWWSFGDPAERRARREYRRSLPPLYRWRRVIVTVVALVGTTLLLTAVGRDPVGWVKQRWYDLTGATVVVADVTAEAVPPNSVASSFDAADVVDGAAEDAWATAWSADTPTAEGCGGATGVGRIVLLLEEPTRIRGLDVWAGVSRAGDRQRQFRPRRLDISFGNECVTRELEDRAGRQPVEFDTGVEVDSLTIAVGSAYAPKTAPPVELVAIGRIDLLRRPS